MSNLRTGENAAAPTGPWTVTVTCPASLDVSAVLLGANGRVRSDTDLVFFNNPAGPGVTHRGGGHNAIVVDPHRVPADVAQVTIVASLDGSGPASFGAAGALRARVVGSDGECTFDAANLGAETALIAVDLYRRGDGWKVRAVGQGYASGLAGVATDFGVNIDDDPPATPVQQAAPPPPPPSARQAPAPQGALPMRSDLFSAQHAEVSGLGIHKQGGKMVKVGLSGEVLARSGAMVAYQGAMEFKPLGSGGIGRAIRSHLTGEGVPIMRVTGNGDLFLANAGQDVHLIDLDGSDGLSINGSNVLAFEPSLRYDVKLVRGAGAAAGGAVQLRVHRRGPDRDHYPRASGSAQRRPPHLRRPAGVRRVVGQPANQHDAK